MSPSLSAITGNHKMATVPKSMGYTCRGLGSMTNSQLASLNMNLVVSVRLNGIYNNYPSHQTVRDSGSGLSSKWSLS